jgi:hypothetical protein
MKLKATIITLTAALGLTISAHANIGDTLKQSQARYHSKGESIENGKGVHFYYKGWSIDEAFNVDGRCDFIMYSKGNKADMSAEEVAACLSANNPSGLEWQAYNGNPNNAFTWQIENTLFAMWYVSGWVNDKTGATGTRQTVRIATRNALIALGWMPGNQETTATSVPL